MSRRPPSRTSVSRAHTAVLTLALSLLVGSAVAQETPATPVGLAPTSDPVLVQLGGVRETASFVMERFEIAVRGVASSQGLTFDQGLVTQLYGFLPTFLEQRARELVLLAQAQARGIVVEEAEVDAIVDRVRASYANDEVAFLDALAAAGFRSEERLRLMVRENELVQRTLASIRDSVVVTPEELTVAYYAQRLRFSTAAEVCVRHILVANEERASAMVAEIEAGAAFAELARVESIDAGSGARGGELGCIRQGLTVPEFDRAAFSAPVGATVGPVASQFGFHVIQVFEARPARIRSLDEVRTELEAELRAERVDATIAAIIGASGVRIFPHQIPPLDDTIDPAAGI
jgi:peptidyl-prolyl cis-trans isomerase C